PAAPSPGSSPRSEQPPSPAHPIRRIRPLAWGGPFHWRNGRTCQPAWRGIRGIRDGTASGVAVGASRNARLQVAAAGLLPLDRLEQGLEIALAETERTVPLDELEEHRRPVADGCGEDLQQVAVLVPIDKNSAALQLFDRDAYLADSSPKLRILVVGIRGREELDPVCSQGVDRGQKTPGRERDVLAARSAVILQVLVDL